MTNGFTIITNNFDELYKQAMLETAAKFKETSEKQGGFLYLSDIPKGVTGLQMSKFIHKANEPEGFSQEKYSRRAIYFNPHTLHL